jgi:tRNA G18 (ribose-2'-O)-methylase SpoU
MTQITDINDARIQVYRSLREQAIGQGTASSFIAEGEKVALKALKSNCEILSLFALEDYHLKYAELIEASSVPADARYVCARELMAEIIGFSMHQGMLVCVQEPDNAALNELTSPIVALNGLADSENVGVIVRNCVAFGVTSLIVDGFTSSPWLRRAVRVSMGAVFEMQVHRCSSLVPVIKSLRQQNSFSIYASEMHEKAIECSQIEFAQNSLLIFGSEGKGVAPELLSLCDAIVHIPVSPAVDSLNVGAASAVVLHRMFEQSTKLNVNDQQV